jgi:phenylalanyl-tRNA synthetase alpha chain
MEHLDQLVQQATADFAAAADGTQLEQAKARYLGKSGSLTEQLKSLGKLDPDARRDAGAAINAAKTAIEAELETRRGALREAALMAQLAAEALDVTLPGRGASLGGLHPVSRTLERIELLFASIGFVVADGPEIETDWHNFTALNTPRITQRVRCTTPFTSKGTTMSCCARTPVRCRSGPCRRMSSVSRTARRCPSCV